MPNYDDFSVTGNKLLFLKVLVFGSIHMKSRIRIYIWKMTQFRNLVQYLLATSTSFDCFMMLSRWGYRQYLVLVLLVPGSLELGDAALGGHLDCGQVPVTDTPQ